MNESGRAVREAMHAFDAEAKNIIIIHDDSDIPSANSNARKVDGSAGHNGIKSIIEHLHTEDFARIRIGIREKDEDTPEEGRRLRAIPHHRHRQKKVFEEVFKKISADRISKPCG